jgi:hypothetical protein
MPNENDINNISKEMDICIIARSIEKNNGEIRKSFACYDEKIYAAIEKKAIQVQI